MKKIGVIVSYDDYQEYRTHMEEMLELGYMCMDYIPEGLDSSYIQFIRYKVKNDNE